LARHRGSAATVVSFRVQAIDLLESQVINGIFAIYEKDNGIQEAPVSVGTAAHRDGQWVVVELSVELGEVVRLKFSRDDGELQTATY